MTDCDVSPSFSEGPKSYFARLKESKAMEYIVERLGFIPESKKGVILFPEWKDYEKVLDNQLDDYYPCLIAVQYRMLENKDGSWTMNTFFYSRGFDAYQKAHGNLAAIVLISQRLAPRISKKLKRPIFVGSMTGFITDCHIYENNFKEAKATIEEYNKKGI